MAGKKWSDLSMRSRKLIIGASVAEGVLKTAALIDIKRRPASEIRGPKWVWVPVVVILNSCGAVPLAYFLFGRRPAPAAESDQGRARPRPIPTMTTAGRRSRGGVSKVTGKIHC